MASRTSYIVVFVTSSNDKEAKIIARELIEHKIAACVNMIPKINSIFWWEKKIDNADEILLIIKSKYTALGKIIKTVKKLHSYQVPEIIALPIIGGNKDYLSWIHESVD
ncbi:MAG: divalent-cation tolerance protein CutA [Candidatus Omnitrophica bacterium]|nr:divalent-cation tolerance protein CutA [Candidatus Omnitrophota bacterium]